MLELLGVFLPALIDLVNSKITESRARFWVSAVICFAVGVLVNYVEHNGLSGYSGMTLLGIADTVSKSALAMFGIAQVSYKAFWEESDLRESMSLNAKTNGTD